MGCFGLQNAERGDPHQQDQADRGKNGMGSHIQFAADWNHGQKIAQNTIIVERISKHPVGNEEKSSQRNQNRQINGAVEFIPLLAFVLGKHADANHNIGDDYQNSGQNGKKTGMGKNFA